jgi:uncharacterized membrane protein YbhN (UPF0104 family)
MFERKQLIKWLKITAKLAVVALLAWMIRGTLESAFKQLQEHTWHIEWPWLLAAGSLYLLGTFPNALFWSQVIAATDHPVGLFAPVRSFYVSAIGKYVPGKAMVLVLRAATMRETQVPATIVTIGVFYETLNNMAVGSLMALLILLPQSGSDPKLILAALGMLAVTGLPIVPPVFKLALRYSGLKKFNPSAVEKLNLISTRVLVTGWATLAVGWWIQGLSLWATLHALSEPSTSLGHWPEYTAVIAMSVVAGFLALLPAGVGAREFVTIELLKLAGASDSTAVISAILLRLVSVVADVGISTILYFVRPRAANGTEQDDAATVDAAAVDVTTADEEE